MHIYKTDDSSQDLPTTQILKTLPNTKQGVSNGRK